jgi:GTP-binding protein
VRLVAGYSDPTVLYDKAKIWVEGGRGGHGCVSFRREAHVPRGGPDGGDGGAGGNVVLVCDPSKRDLGALRGTKHFRAPKGRNGEGSGRHGARGADLEIPVAPGTQAIGLDGEQIDLTRPGQRAVLARGGRGGHGNRRFATSTRQAPRFAERGDPGQEGWVELRLKLLADIGLIGLPNAGKSSLIARLTRAAPKVADYPFTTLSPVLGTLELDNRQAVIADIPGLIEGAADGAGLGHEFLAHVERCAMLVHVVELQPLEGDPATNYETVRAELAGYGAGLDRLPELIFLSKTDLMPAEEAEAELATWRDRFPAAEGEAHRVLAGSSATGEGMDVLAQRMMAALSVIESERDSAPAGGETGGGLGPGELPEFEAEHRVYRPGGEEGYTIEREEDAFRINGRGVEILFARHDLANEEALAYLEQRLVEMGVVAALRAAGFEPGDEVRVGPHELEFYPGS